MFFLAFVRPWICHLCTIEMRRECLKLNQTIAMGEKRYIYLKVSTVVEHFVVFFLYHWNMYEVLDVIKPIFICIYIFNIDVRPVLKIIIFYKNWTLKYRFLYVFLIFFQLWFTSTAHVAKGVLLADNPPIPKQLNCNKFKRSEYCE